jgi:hypothetical protein
MFLNKEILDAVIGISQVYDSMICSNDYFYHDFKSDIWPIMNIMIRVFESIRCQQTLILFNQFYTKLFRLSSKELKNCK